MPQAMRNSRGRILASAAELFAARGYEATSVNDVCRAAATTKPTLYYFHGSKQGLYRHVLECAIAELGGAIRPRFFGGERAVVERVREAILACFEAARRQPAQLRLVLEAVGCTGPQAFQGARGDLRAQVLQALMRVLNAGVSTGELAPGPCECRALVLLGGVTAALTGHLSSGDPDLGDGLADRIVGSTLGAWCPAGTRGPRA